ncbi:hypothetical protein LPJ57_005235, partial [Coemansia sp. RSA 486]
WSKEFDIDALLGDIDSQALAGANNDAASSRRAMVMEGRTVVQDAEMQMQIEAGGEDSDSELDSDDDAMDEDADEVADEAAGPAASSYIVDLPQTRKTKAKETSQSSTNVTVIQTVSSSRNINAEQRKLKKKQAKLEARALANAANDMMADESDDGDDSYDFGTYFKQPDANGQAAAESDSDEDL